MTQKLVLDFNEEGISSNISQINPKGKIVVIQLGELKVSNGIIIVSSSGDWIYEEKMYRPDNYTLKIDTPFFFTIHFEPTKDLIFLGKYKPSDTSYVEKLFYISE